MSSHHQPVVASASAHDRLATAWTVISGSTHFRAHAVAANPYGTAITGEATGSHQTGVFTAQYALARIAVGSQAVAAASSPNMPGAEAR